ncbi:histidine phosphatase family protein [Demequina sp. SO4-13]|uniref:histidine phosphatase family protein n=1 Tax=Demequina sp. SO4-13 TaxID=3401027 RepID=UPI003AF87816
MTAEATSGKSLFEITPDGLVSPLTLVLVRHGVTDMTASHALSGSSQEGPPLNSQGRIQAAKAADAVYRIGRRSWERVPQVTRVLASPMARTQETAAAIGRRIGAHVETEVRVREIDFGEWEGLSADEIEDHEGEALHRWMSGEIPAPGGEAIPQVGARFDEFLVEAAADHARQCAEGKDVPRAWAVTSHAVAIKSAVALSLGVPADSWMHLWPSPASITLLQLRVLPDGTISSRHVLAIGVPTD